MEIQKALMRTGLGMALSAGSSLAWAVPASPADTAGGSFWLVGAAVAALLLIIAKPGLFAKRQADGRVEPAPTVGGADDGWVPTGYVSPTLVRYGYVSPYSDDELEDDGAFSAQSIAASASLADGAAVSAEEKTEASDVAAEGAAVDGPADAATALVGDQATPADVTAPAKEATPRLRGRKPRKARGT